MSGTVVPPTTAQGNAVVLDRDYPRLIYTAPRFEIVALAEIIEPSVTEAVEALLPSLVPPYVQDAANEAVAQQAVLLTGSTMLGPLFLNPVIPTQPSQAASMQYVDTLVATSGLPEVPPVPSGQTWARQTGQWVPVDPTGGNFLPLAGGTMQGAINMGGNAINNLPAIPTLPNGAASAQWVLNQIAAQSLYQGTWTPDTNTPDLTQPGTHQNGFTWIVTTATVGGVVISQPIPGLQGQTVFNGDTIIYSALAGAFQIIHGGGLSLEEAQALFLPLAGGQLSGALLLNANATQPTQATTLQQVQGLVAGAGIPEAPNDGQVYGRNGLAVAWQPVLPIAGGSLSGALLLAANATQNLGAVPLQQLNSALGNYVPLAGNVTMTGPLTMGSAATLTLNANAAAALQAVPLQQLTSVLTGYLPLSGGTLAGPLTMPTGTVSGNLTVGGTMTVDGPSTLAAPATIMGGTTAAVSGQIGQVLTQVIASQTIVSSVQELGSMSLPPGVWFLTGSYFSNAAGANPMSVVSGWVGLSTASQAGQAGIVMGGANPDILLQFNSPTNPLVVTLTSAGTAYLMINIAVGAGSPSPTAGGMIVALRIA